MKVFFRLGLAMIATLLVTAVPVDVSGANKVTRVCCDSLEKDSPIVRCTESWLQLVDAGDYRQAWIASSDLNQCRHQFQSWIDAMYKWRKPFGKVVSREFLSADCFQVLRGYPTGDYYAVQYKTEFQNMCVPACEFVILHCECDCAGCKRWKVVCYSIY